MSYLDLKFQWYKNGITNIKPSGLISLQQLIQTTINPKEPLKEAFKAIHKAAENGDKKLRDELKTKHLFFTTPSVIVEPIRNYDSIKSFLPFCVLEHDNIDYAEDLRDYVFEKQKSCIFAFSSPSRKGCKFIFHIDTPKSVDHYKELFWGLAYDLDKFLGFDTSNARPTQPLFISWDENAKYREDAVPSFRRGYKTNCFDVDKSIEFQIPESIDPEVELKVVNRIEYLVNKIVDSAHPQIVGISFLTSGWVSGNYIHQDLAYDTLIHAIENNDYMSKNTRAYKQTAQTMFNKGLAHPAEFR